MTLSLLAAEISHENTPLHIREKLATNEVQIKEHLSNLSQSIQEVFILSTCNRFAIYILGQDIKGLKKYFKRNPEEIASHIIYYTNSVDTVQHLFDTASGLL